MTTIHLTRRQQVLITGSALLIFALGEASTYLLGTMNSIGDFLQPVFLAAVVWFCLAAWASRVTQLIEEEIAAKQKVKELAYKSVGLSPPEGPKHGK